MSARLLLLALLVILTSRAILARRSPELAADEEWWSQGVRDVYCDGLAA